mmetsp:Transcript_1395/g.2294  ORF Transcript_1395/g.2294 Transcript_1395/m.2294 type:complete len:451 (-) Transcript_1395:852-2204(-)
MMSAVAIDAPDEAHLLEVSADDGSAGVGDPCPDDADDDFVSSWYLVCIASIGVCGGGIYGYNVGATAYLNQIKDEFGLDEVGQEIVSSAATVSDAISMFFVGMFILDRFGRRNTVLVAAVFNVIGSFIGGSSSGFYELVFARFVQGVGNGMSILAVPMLIAECSPRSWRGLIVSFFQVGVVTGVAAPYLIQLAFNRWALTVAVGGMPGLCLIILLGCIWSQAESRSWKEAKEEEEAGELVEHDYQNEHPVATFSTGVVLAIVLAFTNNSSDAILFYGPQIFAQAGIGNEKSLWSAFALAAINIPAVVLVSAIIHRFSRRSMLLGGLGVIIVCYTIVGIVYCLHSSHIYVLAVISFLTLMFAYQIGPGTLFIVVLPELFTQKKRASGMAIGTVFMSLFSILCNGTMLTTIKHLGVGPTFLLYGFLYVVCFLYLWKKLPESGRVEIVHHHHY